MAEVFLCEEGQLTTQSKRELKKAGVIVAEVKDIARVQFVRASEIISADDLLWAVLDALNHKSQYGSDGAKQREQLSSQPVVCRQQSPPCAHSSRAPMTSKTPLPQMPIVRKGEPRPCAFCPNLTRARCPACQRQTCAVCSLRDEKHRCAECRGKESVMAKSHD
jgi:hypothetical protein